jgi:hypothetical protein
MRLTLLPLLISFLTGCDKNSGQPSGASSPDSAEAADHSSSEEPAERAKPDTLPAKPTEKFTGSFRESFSHSDLLEIAHNPHGGATTVSFGYKDKPVGFLHVRETPPMNSVEDFSEAGKDSLKKRYSVDEVEYHLVTNSKGNTYLRFDAKVPGTVIDKRANREGSEGFVALMAVFFDKQSGGTDGQKMVRGMFGTFQFEFVIPESDVTTVSAEIERVLDTFELPDTGAAGGGDEKDGGEDAE